MKYVNEFINSASGLAARTITAAALLTLTACGYTFEGSGSVLPEDVRVIAILPVENQTTESGLGPRFTEVLRSRFERHGVVKLTDDPRSADAVLKTRIRSVDSRVRNVRGTTDVEVSNDLVVSIASELKRRTGQTLWRDEDLRVTNDFQSVPDLVVTGSSAFAESDIDEQNLANLSTRELSRGQKQQALDDILEEAARQIYTDAVAADF